MEQSQLASADGGGGMEGEGGETGKEGGRREGGKAPVEGAKDCPRPFLDSLTREGTTCRERQMLRLHDVTRV